MRGRARVLFVFALVAAAVLQAAGGVSVKPSAKGDDARPTSWTSVSRSESSAPKEATRTQKPVARPKSATGVEKDKPVSPSSDNGSVSRSETGTPQEPGRTQKPPSTPRAKKDRPGTAPSSDNGSVSRPESSAPGEAARVEKPAVKSAPQAEPVRKPVPQPVPFIQSYNDNGAGGGRGSDQGRGGNNERGGSGYDRGRGGNDNHGRRDRGHDRHRPGWDRGWHGRRDNWRHRYYRGSWDFLWWRGPVVFPVPVFLPHVVRMPHYNAGVYVRQTGSDAVGAQFASAVEDRLRQMGLRRAYSSSDAALELYMVTMDEDPEDPGWGSAVSISYIWNSSNRFITAQLLDVGHGEVDDLARSVAGYADQLIGQYR